MKERTNSGTNRRGPPGRPKKGRLQTCAGGETKPISTPSQPRGPASREPRDPSAHHHQQNDGEAIERTSCLGVDSGERAGGFVV